MPCSRPYRPGARFERKSQRTLNCPRECMLTIDLANSSQRGGMTACWALHSPRVSASNDRAPPSRDAPPTPRSMPASGGPLPFPGIAGRQLSCPILPSKPTRRDGWINRVPLIVLCHDLRHQREPNTHARDCDAMVRERRRRRQNEASRQPEFRRLG